MTDNRTTERIDHPPRVREAIDELMRKKDVTDNRATELLHKLLIARGVEFDTDIDECCYYEPPKTTWDFVLCGLEMTVTAKEFVDVEGKKYLEMDFHHAFTPEQAIAVTLGSERIAELEAENERLRKAGYEIGYHDAMKAAKRGGTLIAEQVSKAVYTHSIHADCADADWQAIADELNAVLGSGTCRIEERNGDWYCEACGEMVGTCDPASELCIDGNAVELWNFCPNCGKKVVSA